MRSILSSVYKKQLVVIYMWVQLTKGFPVKKQCKFLLLP